MRFFTLLIFLMPSLGCDTMSKRFDIDKCMSHIWMSGTYKVTKIDGLDVYLKNVSGGNDKVISKLDRGWNDVPCP